MYCHKCGTQNSDSASFCKSCGADLTIAHQTAFGKGGGSAATAIPLASSPVQSKGSGSEAGPSRQEAPAVAPLQPQASQAGVQSGVSYVRDRGNPLSAVGFVSGVVAAIGWITLFVGGFGILVMWPQISPMLGARANGMGLTAVLTSFIPLVLIALGPFYLWAILKSMREIHAQGNQVLDGLDRLNASIRAAAASAASASAVSTPPATDRATDDGKPAADPSLG